MKKRGTALVLCILLALGLLAAAASAEEVTLPEITVEAREIPDNEALRMVRDMKAGWNLGNTFDANECSWLSNKMDYESAWCGVKTPKGLMDALWDAGFRTLRLPVSWHNHVSADFTIDEDWLSRVEEVASWAYEKGMYVILNIHHDCDKRFYYPDSAHLENSTAYMKAIWTQLAARFADWGDHLIFESINEPRLRDTAHEWQWDENDAACLDAMACICKLNQVFVDTVRAGGGQNGTRYLMVPAYDASPDYACREAFTLPEDTADNRIIVSAHAYTPYDFALNTSGGSTFSLEDGSQTREIDWFMDRLYDTYVSKGIPVVIGEYGALIKGNNMQDRVNFTAYYVASARARGLTTCWWDNHAFTGNGEKFGIIDRKTLEWKAPKILEAIMANCGE